MLLVYRACQIYAVIGLPVAAAFALWGIDRVVPDARGAYAFRPLLLPGLVLLWPAVLWRWAVLARGPAAVPLGRAYRATHRAVWGVLVVLLPLALLAALALRQEAGQDPLPQRLEAPAP